MAQRATATVVTAGRFEATVPTKHFVGEVNLAKLDFSHDSETTEDPYELDHTKKVRDPSFQVCHWAPLSPDFHRTSDSQRRIRTKGQRLQTFALEVDIHQMTFVQRQRPGDCTLLVNLLVMIQKARPSLSIFVQTNSDCKHKWFTRRKTMRLETKHQAIGPSANTKWLKEQKALLGWNWICDLVSSSALSAFLEKNPCSAGLERLNCPGSDVSCGRKLSSTTTWAWPCGAHLRTLKILGQRIWITLQVTAQPRPKWPPKQLDCSCFFLCQSARSRENPVAKENLSAMGPVWENQQ